MILCYIGIPIKQPLEALHAGGQDENRQVNVHQYQCASRRNMYGKVALEKAWWETVCEIANDMSIVRRVLRLRTE